MNNRNLEVRDTGKPGRKGERNKQEKLMECFGELMKVFLSLICAEAPGIDGLNHRFWHSAGVILNCSHN